MRIPIICSLVAGAVAHAPSREWVVAWDAAMGAAQSDMDADDAQLAGKLVELIDTCRGAKGVGASLCTAFVITAEFLRDSAVGVPRDPTDLAIPVPLEFEWRASDADLFASLQTVTRNARVAARARHQHSEQLERVNLGERIWFVQSVFQRDSNPLPHVVAEKPKRRRGGWVDASAGVWTRIPNCILKSMALLRGPDVQLDSLLAQKAWRSGAQYSELTGAKTSAAAALNGAKTSLRTLQRELEKAPAGSPVRAEIETAFTRYHLFEAIMSVEGPEMMQYLRQLHTRVIDAPAPVGAALVVVVDHEMRNFIADLVRFIAQARHIEQFITAADEGLRMYIGAARACMDPETLEAQNLARLETSIAANGLRGTDL